MNTIKVRVLFKNHKNGQSYVLVRADDVAATCENLDSICKICNQPAVYDFLFRARFKGRPYSVEDARDFLEWGAKGWREQKYFLFLVIDAQNRVCAAVDIKSNTLERAEIGYWASAEHAGVMTPAVKEFLRIARKMGFRTLYACVKMHNTRSMGVLERNSFIRLNKEDIRNGESFVVYERVIVG